MYETVDPIWIFVDEEDPFTIFTSLGEIVAVAVDVVDPPCSVDPSDLVRVGVSVQVVPFGVVPFGGVRMKSTASDSPTANGRWKVTVSVWVVELYDPVVLVRRLLDAPELTVETNCQVQLFMGVAPEAFG